MGAWSVHMEIFSAAAACAASKDFPLTYSATARRSATLSAAPCGCIFPFVNAFRIAPGGKFRSISRGGALLSMGLPGFATEVCTMLRWHAAQAR